MWQLLKADYRDNRYFILVPLIIILIPIVANQIQGWPTVTRDISGIRSLVLAGMLLIYLFFYSRSAQQKTDRQRMLLPISLQKVGLSRILFGPSVWILLSLIFILGTSNIRPYPTELIYRPLLAANGLVLVLNAFPFIHRDLSFCFPEKNLKVIFTISFLMFLLGIYFFGYILTSSIPYFSVLKEFDPAKQSLNQNMISTPGIILLNLFGLGLTICSLILFSRRKLYLE